MEELPETNQPAAGRKKLLRSLRREQAAADALRTLIRDLAEREFVTSDLPDRELDLQLRLRVAPTDDWALRFSPPVGQQVAEQLGDCLAERGMYREGVVHCFRCGTSGCEHVMPSSPLEVFAGYESAGLPRFHELPQAFLRARDERVQHLYGETPILAALVEPGKALKADLLSSFGRASKAYALLGQVTAGYFVRGGSSGGGRFAVSFQFVETRTPTGQVALHVNPVCRLPGGGGLADLYAEGWGEWVLRAHRKASDLLEGMARRINEAGDDRHRVARATLVKVPGIMRRLAASLDRGHRQTRRRTRHAEQRRREQRPVQKAVEDAHNAGDDRLLFEDRTEAVVVAGPQFRIHLFSTTGKHMTSFIGKPDTVAHRMRSGRWRLLDSGQAAQFRKALLAADPGDEESFSEDHQ